MIFSQGNHIILLFDAPHYHERGKVERSITLNAQKKKILHDFKGWMVTQGHFYDFLISIKKKMNSLHTCIVINYIENVFKLFLNSHQTIHQQHSNLLIFYLRTLQVFIKLLRYILSQITQTCSPTASSSCIINKLFT